MAPDRDLVRAFFGSKKPWSVQKDLILRNYLPPYLNKVLSWAEGRVTNDLPVLIADVFAGPGRFRDGSPGSPVHIIEAAERAAAGRYSAVFGNEDREQHEQLVELLKRYEHAHPLHQASHALLGQIREHVGDRALFAFIDPMGAFGYEYDLIEPLVARIKGGLSTELLINFFINDVHRKSARDRVLEVGISGLGSGIRTRLDRLDRVLGGDWWRDIEYDRQLGPEDRTERIMEGYVSRLKDAGFRYVGRCPVRERDEEQPH
jgi:three-Cys-motif partner protein